MPNQRESELVRLYPSVFNLRRYYLVQLRKQINSVIHLFIKDDQKVKLLDYGCGNTPYRSLFQSKVKEYHAADIEKNNHVDILINIDGQIPVNDESYGFVLSTQVLEHVENVNFYLSESNRILDKNGLLILTTHGYWIFHPDPNDFWRWTSQGLKKIINESGFEIIYFKGILGRSAMGIQLLQDGFIFKLPKFILPVFALFMQSLVWLFDKTTTQATRDKDACTFIVVARKI